MTREKHSTLADYIKLGNLQRHQEFVTEHCADMVTKVLDADFESRDPFALVAQVTGTPKASHEAALCVLAEKAGIRIMRSPLGDFLLENYERHMHAKCDCPPGSVLGLSGPDPLGVPYLAVRSDLSDVMRLNTMIHELSHLLLRHSFQRRDTMQTWQKEFEAELTAYVVQKHIGIDCFEHSLNYLQNTLDQALVSYDLETVKTTFAPLLVDAIEWAAVTAALLIESFHIYDQTVEAA